MRRITWKRVMDMNTVPCAISPSCSAARATATRARTGSTSWWRPRSWRYSGHDLAQGPEGAPRQHRDRLHARPEAGACKDLKVHGAMTVLLKDALAPNLVQTLENNPASTRRPVREHRARLQLGDRDPDGAEARRLRRHRGRLRGRPARRSSSTSSAARRACDPARW